MTTNLRGISETQKCIKKRGVRERGERDERQSERRLVLVAVSGL